MRVLGVTLQSSLIPATEHVAEVIESGGDPEGRGRPVGTTLQSKPGDSKRSVDVFGENAFPVEPLTDRCNVQKGLALPEAGMPLKKDQLENAARERS